MMSNHLYGEAPSSLMFAEALSVEITFLIIWRVKQSKGVVMDNESSYIKVEHICSGCGKPIYNYVAYWLLPDGVALHGKKCYQLFQEREKLENEEAA